MALSNAGVRLFWPGRPEPRAASIGELRHRRGSDPNLRLIHGDNAAALRVLAQSGVRVALAYLDPPFFTGREHTLVERRDGRTDESTRVHAFDDRWESLEAYLESLVERVRLTRELLLPEGCLVLHVDPRTSHYLKVLCDEVFGAASFASEIVWRYRRWPSKTRNFQRVHDVLLRYVRDPERPPRFRQLYEPLAASTLATWGNRKQRAVVDASGRRVRSSKTEEATPGTPLGDVWDIGIVAPVAKERTGYPTQKPEALLERLITSCTDPGDLVLDPYFGSGTTGVVCARLGRRVVGVDSNRRAITIARRRLAALDADPVEERLIEPDDAEPDARDGDETSLSRAG
jgi:site-specific DNA-methyltransferase (adenine-specific)